MLDGNGHGFIIDHGNQRFLIERQRFDGHALELETLQVRGLYLHFLGNRLQLRIDFRSFLTGQNNHDGYFHLHSLTWILRGCAVGNQ